MIITIRSAEKKLTKSIIYQMNFAGTEVIEKGTLLGYVNCKESYLLIEYDGKYFRHSLGWHKWDDAPRASRKIGKWSQSTKADQPETEFTRWWSAYCKMRDDAEQIYI